MGANKSPGRPTKLDADVADRLVDMLADGGSAADAAAACGISRRTLQKWRARAWSRDPRDRPFVVLAQRLQAVSADQRRRHPPAPDAVELDWRVFAARLTANNPERWPELPDDVPA